MKVRILRTAMVDLSYGRRFYERQGAGLGDYFFDTLLSDIDSLRLHAGIHRRVYGHHRLVSRRFPYAVYYDVINETAFVFHVFDCRRDPRLIQRALRSSD